MVIRVGPREIKWVSIKCVYFDCSVNNATIIIISVMKAGICVCGCVGTSIMSRTVHPINLIYGECVAADPRE